MLEADDQSGLRFGEVLKGYRRRARVSQKMLGNSLGFSQSGIARVESGNKEPPLDPTFYSGIRRSLHLSFEEALILASAAHVPEWIIEDLPGVHPSLSVDGIQVFIKTTDSDSILRPDELHVLDQIIKHNTELVITDFFDDRAKRARIIRQQVSNNNL